MGIIADLGSNWRMDQDLELAKAKLSDWLESLDPTIIDVIKLQCWVTDRFVDRSKYPAAAVAALDYYQVPPEWYQWLIAKVTKLGFTFASTPCDVTTAELLYLCGQRHWKLASGDLTNAPLLTKVAELAALDPTSTVTISTGNGALGEASAALTLLRMYTTAPITVMHCVSRYPTAVSACGWQTLTQLQALVAHYTNVTVGWSSHVVPHRAGEAMLVATTLGATAIEVHLRAADCPMSTPDYWHSLTPNELTKYVRQLADHVLALHTTSTIDPNERRWARRGPDGRRPNNEQNK